MAEPQIDPSEELDQVVEDAPEEVEEPQEPTLVRIRYAGNTYEVPEHLADAWHRREEEFQNKLSSQATDLRKRWEAREQPPAPRQSQPPESSDTLAKFLESPEEVLSAREQRLRQELRDEMRQEQLLQQAQQRYWAKFYADNKDLADHEDVVEFIVGKHRGDLEQLDPMTAQKEIATRTRSFLGRSPQGRPLQTRQVQTERPSNPSPPPRQRQTEEPSRPRFSYGPSVIHELQERRRKAQHGIKD